MKTYLSILLFLLMATAFVHADVHIQLVSHTESYYFGGITYPETNEEWETWIGDNRFVSITEQRSVVLSLNTNIMLFINHSDSTYVETTLPFSWPNLVSEEMAGRLKTTMI